MSVTQRQLKTASGVIRYPAYIPVTTFGKKYPLDALIQPYLPRLSQAVMVSYHYARQMKQRPRLPLLIDSGGFAALFEGTRIVEEGSLGVLEIPTKEGVERLHPADVLDFQERNADIAFTLDFPIPPKTNLAEAERRQRLTIANAIWTLRNRRRQDLRLFACIQAWDEHSAAQCTVELAAHPFDGFAIGGLVPRVREWDVVAEIVSNVQQHIDERPLHVLGLGKPETTARLFEIGVDSVDSSSYVKLAADGKLWSTPNCTLLDPSPQERLRLALENLARASQVSLPLSFISASRNHAFDQILN
jgi:tRNA-guanine family transglycosylase